MCCLWTMSVFLSEQRIPAKFSWKEKRYPAEMQYSGSGMGEGGKTEKTAAKGAPMLVPLSNNNFKSVDQWAHK